MGIRTSAIGIEAVRNKDADNTAPCLDINGYWLKTHKIHFTTNKINTFAI